MPDYRRNQVPGHILLHGEFARPSFGIAVAEIGALRESVRAVRARYPFHVDGWVVLPDHMHCVWTLPDRDCGFALRWAGIKSGFSRRISLSWRAPTARGRKRESGIWQRRYWEHTIRDERDYAAHMDYVHFNRVKHGLAAHPGLWPHSTFGRCVRQGIYPAD